MVTSVFFKLGVPVSEELNNGASKKVYMKNVPIGEKIRGKIVDFSVSKIVFKGVQETYRTALREKMIDAEMFFLERKTWQINFFGLFRVLDSGVSGIQKHQERRKKFYVKNKVPLEEINPEK
jgi:hypothetical protein